MTSQGRASQHSEANEKSLLYIDSSAYLASLLNEAGGDIVRKASKKYGLCSSILLVTEVQRNLIRLAREKVISEEEYDEAFTVFRQEQGIFLFKHVDLDIIEDPSVPATRIPRTLDLLHLRTARWFQSKYPWAGFLSFDNHQKFCAEEMGIKLFRP